jgi:hypothetical protein
MQAPEVARALQVPLTYVRGRPGDEVYLAVRENGSSFLFKHRDELYLQFRHGRLTGWKLDWSNDWLRP